MNKTIVLVNHLQELLSEQGMTQKELAKKIGEREATISEFMNFKRSTINMDLLLKIASALNISNLDKLLSLKKIFYIGNYKQNEWYAFPNNKFAKFCYRCNSHKQTFEIAEIIENGTLIHQRYDITDLDKENIQNEFSKLELSLPDSPLDDITLMLIELCKYEGEQVLIIRQKTIEEALTDLEMLF